jgi:hypothetical protein
LASLGSRRLRRHVGEPQREPEEHGLINGISGGRAILAGY